MLFSVFALCQRDNNENDPLDLFSLFSFGIQTPEKPFSFPQQRENALVLSHAVRILSPTDDCFLVCNQKVGSILS